MEKDRRLKSSHKSLMIIEAGYIYCHRYNLDFSKFIDEIFMSDDFDSSEGSEFDNICKDLRLYKAFRTHVLLEITEEEYDMCIDKFGEA